MTKRRKARTPKRGARRRAGSPSREDNGFRLAYVDAPWQHDNYGMKRHGAAKAHYDEMPIEELCALPVPKIMNPRGSLIAMWCTGPKQAEGSHLQLARAWGYKLVSKLFCWVKVQRKCKGCGHDWDDHTQHHWDPPGFCQYSEGKGKKKKRCTCRSFQASVYFGTGNYTGGNTEDCWLGRKGNWPASKRRRRRDVRQALLSPLPRREDDRPQHSAKPDAFGDRIHWLWPDVPKVELFAREPHDAFDAWGRQVTEGGIVIPEMQT